MSEVHLMDAEKKYTYWIFDDIQEINGKAKLDVYVCAECGYEHKVLHNVKPIMPFCWQCKRIVRES